jgi:Helix-turn-helix domain
MAEDLTRGSHADQSGWVTTKIAARTLRVDPRTIRKYIKQGKLEAISEGEGVEKTYLVSIDSLHELRGTRPEPPADRVNVPPESARAAINADPTSDLVALLRDLTKEVSQRSSEAAELRTRLELTERAETSQREALEQRLVTEQVLREQAERERDELAAELEALREEREAPEARVDDMPSESLEPSEPPEGSETASEDESGGEVPPEQQEPVERRSSWWRRFFGLE